jgi:hypothetical protein
MYTRIMFKFVQRKGAIRVFRSVFLVLSSHYSVKGASKNEHVALNCVAKQIQEINQRGAANQGVCPYAAMTTEGPKILAEVLPVIMLPYYNLFPTHYFHQQ